MLIEENKSLVRRMFLEDLSGGDESVADELFSIDFYDRTNPPGMQHGIDGHKALVRLFRGAFPDMTWSIDDLVGEGDTVAILTTLRATHQGEFFGIPATGQSVCVTGIHFLRIKDGKIEEHWGNNDDLGLMQQIGVVPQAN